MENCIFVNKSVSGSQHPLFSQVYLFANDYHNHDAILASNNFLKILTNNTSIYFKKSFETATITSWNFFQSHFTCTNLKGIYFNQIKHLIKNYLFNLYKN